VSLTRIGGQLGLERGPSSVFCLFASGALVPVLFGTEDWAAVVIVAALVGSRWLGTGYAAARAPTCWAARSVPL